MFAIMFYDSDYKYNLQSKMQFESLTLLIGHILGEVQIPQTRDCWGLPYDRTTLVEAIFVPGVVFYIDFPFKMN